MVISPDLMDHVAARPRSSEDEIFQSSADCKETVSILPLIDIATRLLERPRLQGET